MIKTFPGTSINYGPLLPPSGPVADGTLFFKTNFDLDGISNPPGLYLYGFRSDTNSLTPGDQVGQGWRIASDLANYVQKTGDVMTGTLTSTATGPAFTLQSQSPGIRFTETDQGVNLKEWLLVADGGNFQVQTRDDTFNTPVTSFYLTRSGAGFLNNQVIWTAGNDGAGSTLDADLLDGQQGSFYSNLANSTGSIDINSRTSGALAVSRGGTNNTVAVQGGVLYGASASQLAYTPVGSVGQLLQSNGTGQPTWISPSSIPSSTANTLATPRQIALSGNATGSVMFDGSANVTIATTVNNSAQLSGLSPSTGVGGNTIAQRDLNGYLFASYLNQSSPNNENGVISQVMVTNGADGFFRKASINALANAVAAAGLTGYVSKTGDTMSGSLQVGDGSGDQLVVNGISLNWSGSSIITSGIVTAPTFNGNLTGTATNATLAAKASTLSQNGGNGAAMTFNWAGQPGQPTWLWGSNDGSSHFVYNPSNFSVANSASLGGVAAAGYARLTGAVFTGDITTYRSGSPTTGVIYLNQAGSAYLFFDGTNYNMVSGGLVLGGTLTASGDVIAYSDRKLKKNIVTIDRALDKVKSLRGVEFDRIEDDTHSVGLIAQEVQEIIPSAVREAEDGTLGVAYGNLVGVLIEAIKEQQKQIDVLTSRLNALID